MTGVVHWGGNVGSLLNALKRTGVPHRLIAGPEQVRSFERLILPGVGNFAAVMKRLRERGLDRALLEAMESGVAYLGICIGMQILLEGSEEAPSVKGLSVVRGACRRYRSGRVPQTGFNRVRSRTGLIEDDEFYYFVNSYYCEPEEDVCVATADYGVRFCAAIEKGRILGVQFHPERSAEAGLRFLKDWCDAR